jgi:hypothetical protein
VSSDASDTGALQALLPVALWGFVIIIAASVALPVLLGALHRLANPEMRTGEEGIWVLKIQMWVLEAPAEGLRRLARAWKYQQEHRFAISFYRGRHRG